MSFFVAFGNAFPILADKEFQKVADALDVLNLGGSQLLLVLDLRSLLIKLIYVSLKHVVEIIKLFLIEKSMFFNVILDPVLINWLPRYVIRRQVNHATSRNRSRACNS